MSNKVRRALAIVALVCMVVFSVLLAIVLASPKLRNGPLGYAALVTGLLGISLFFVVRFVVKGEGTPAYLPTPDDKEPEGADAETDGQPQVQPSGRDEKSAPEAEGTTKGE